MEWIGIALLFVIGATLFLAEWLAERENDWEEPIEPFDLQRGDDAPLARWSDAKPNDPQGWMPRCVREPTPEGIAYATYYPEDEELYRAHLARTEKSRDA